MNRVYKQHVFIVGLFVVFSGVAVDKASAFSPREMSPSLRLHRYPDTGGKRHWALHISSVPKDDRSGVSYGERSRPYRRDVFGYDDWVRHRSSDRFVGNLLDVFKSGVVQQLLREVYLTGSVATFMCVYNALLVNGFDDFAGLHHDPLVQGFYVLALPGVFFALTSPALSLLLGT